MKQILTILAIILLSISTHAQDCGCTISQVESNTVESCDMVVGEIVTVSTESEFYSALGQANNSGGNMTILFEDGTYSLASTSQYPYITASNMVFRSSSGNRDAVIITGQGMQDVAPGSEIGLYLVGDNITVADLTIKDVGNHGIATVSDNHLIHNVRIQNTFEQMFKGNSSGDGADNGVIQCCLMEYTAGIGPQWYIGGIDIHEGDNWLVRDNVFKDIASPSQTLAEHAVHFWDNSANNVVERNQIEGCDRGIGFGLGSSPNSGGIIRNNMIFNNGSQPFNDVGIGLETSPGTQVYNNTVHVAYQNAIEYRFEATMGVLIANNLTNRPITSRNGGQALLTSNNEDGGLAYYVDPEEGDLRLTDTIEGVFNMGVDLEDLVQDDIDQQERPIAGAYDIGAQEYLVFLDMDGDGFTSDIDCDDMNADINPDAMEIPNNGIDEDCDGEDLITAVSTYDFDLRIYPNPSSGIVKIDSDKEISSVVVVDCQGRQLVEINRAFQNVTIDVSAFPSGFYMITIETAAGERATRKVSIMK